MKKLVLVLLCLLSIGCEVKNINYLTPIMVTDEPQSVLGNSAILGGRALGEGGKDITEYGVVWSTSFPPSVDDNKVIEGSRLGSFSSRYEGLESGTVYYYASYGVSEVGVGYGGVYEFMTTPEAPCDPVQDNYIDYRTNQENIRVVRLQESTSFNDGNIEFIGNYGSWPQFILQFYEIDVALPKSGSYIIVNEFNNQSIKSNGEIKVSVSDFSIGSQGGGYGVPGDNIYVTNDTNGITFVFCDIPVGSNYILNGKFTYTE